MFDNITNSTGFQQQYTPSNTTEDPKILFIPVTQEDNTGPSSANDSSLIIENESSTKTTQNKQRLKTAAKIVLLLLILGGVGTGLYFLGVHYGTEIKNFFAAVKKMTPLEIGYKIVLPIAGGVLATGGVLVIGLTAKCGKKVKDKSTISPQLRNEINKTEDFLIIENKEEDNETNSSNKLDNSNKLDDSDETPLNESLNLTITPTDGGTIEKIEELNTTTPPSSTGLNTDDNIANTDN